MEAKLKYICLPGIFPAVLGPRAAIGRSVRGGDLWTRLFQTGVSV